MGAEEVTGVASGVVVGGGYGAFGFYGGPLLGALTTTGGAILGGICGYFVGPCCNECVKTTK